MNEVIDYFLSPVFLLLRENKNYGNFVQQSESGFGNVELRSGKPFVKVVSGHIEVDRFIVSGKR